MTRGSPSSDEQSYANKSNSSPSAPPTSPSSSPPPPHSVFDPEKAKVEPNDGSLSDLDSEKNGILGIPLDALERIEEQLARMRWVVPVLPRQELENLMEIAIKMVENGNDENNDLFTRFLEGGLLISFRRLMTDDAVKDWKVEIQLHIYNAMKRYLRLFMTKLNQSVNDAKPIAEIYWTVLALIINSKNRYHDHNSHRECEISTKKQLENNADENGNVSLEIESEDGQKQEEDDIKLPIVYAEEVEFSRNALLVDLFNNFGENGGFDSLRSYFEQNSPNATLFDLLIWLRPFGVCSTILCSDTVDKYFGNLMKLAVNRLKSTKDEELKCESFKNDIQDSPYLELAKIVRNLAFKLDDDDDDRLATEMAFFRLRFILRVLQVGTFAGRIQALDDLQMVIGGYGSTNSNVLSRRDVSELLVLGLEDEQMVSWLHANDLIDILFRDNLHQPVFVDRLERVLRALLRKKALTEKDIDQMWLARTGKHDVIQRNLHELFARLAPDFTFKHLGQLFDRFKESWREANERERSLLLDLMRRLGVESNDTDLVSKALELLWDVARCSELPLETVEQSLDASFKILEPHRRENLRLIYIEKCIDELRRDSNFVVMALKHMQRIFMTIPEMPSGHGNVLHRVWRNEFITDEQSKYMLCKMLTHNITLYMDRVRDHQLRSPLDIDIAPNTLKLDGWTCHRDQLLVRLDCLQFLLREGRLWLIVEQAMELWDTLVLSAVFPHDRNTGFATFGNMQNNEDLDPDSLVDFFQLKILQLEPSLLNETGLECFESFFKAVNIKDNRLLFVAPDRYFLSRIDLMGSEYLWQIILNSSDRVSDRAIDLFRDIYSNPAQEAISHFCELNNNIIGQSFEQLKLMHDAILANKHNKLANSNLQATKMTRILKILSAYVKVYDEDMMGPGRKRVALHRACLGRSFRISVKLNLNLSSNINNNNNNNNNEGGGAGGGGGSLIGFKGQGAATDEGCEIDVHSNQTMLIVKTELFARFHSAIKTCSSAGKLELFDGQRVFDHLYDGKTITDCSLNELSVLTLKFATLLTNLSSPESSDSRSILYTCHFAHFSIHPFALVHSFERILLLAHFSQSIFNESLHFRPSNRSPLDELDEETENLLPGFAISNLSYSTNFLFLIYDMGSKLNRPDLRDTARYLLQLIPADLKVISTIERAAQVGELTSLFFVDSPGKVLYYLEVIQSLLMPANETHLNQLQESTMLCEGLSVCLQMLTDDKFLDTADVDTANAANAIMLRILEFQLLVATTIGMAQASTSESDECRMDVHERSAILELVPASHEHYLRKLCDSVSQKLLHKETSIPDCRGTTRMDAIHSQMLLRVAYSSASGHPQLEPTSSIDDISSAYHHACRDPVCESIATCSLDALTLGFALVPETAAILHEKIWSRFVEDVLFSEMTTVRNLAAESIFVIVTKNRHRKILLETVDILFANLAKIEQKPKLAHSLTNLLCRLIKFIRVESVQFVGILDRLEAELDWLDKAREYTISHMEPYQMDILLTGHFNIAKELLEFLSTEQKCWIGSDSKGRELIKQLLEDFLLPASKAYAEQRKQQQQVSKTNLQRSATINISDVKSEMDDQDRETPILTAMLAQGVMPRSATTCMTPHQSVAVCSGSESSMAAYEALVALNANSVRNLALTVDILTDMFYSDPIPSVQEWDFAPSVALRGPGSYVGLKNAGATCYMNSVLQQLFMIEPVRHGIVNAPGNTSDFDEEIDEQTLPIPVVDSESRKEYHLTMARCVQMIFANLMASQLQFYTPRRFWRKFWFQREEPFTSISVDIRSHNNLLDSLKEYVKGDLLDNDNAYLCELCNKKVSAIKRLCISKLPRYLTIQLKRFDFDWDRDIPVKFNDYFEFPLQLDMEPYTVAGLERLEHAPETSSVPCETPEQCQYRLRGVVVHSGQANGGHYYSFIRADDDLRWFKFDDADVQLHDISNDQDMRNAWFGGECMTETLEPLGKRYQPRRQKRWWNAYLLIYERLNENVDQSDQSMGTQVHQVADKVHTLTLNTKLRQMTSDLEMVVRTKNTKVVHERNEYSQEFFNFIRLTTSTIACQSFFDSKSLINEDKRKIALLTIQLLSRFLFTTGLHAKRSLRANMQNWVVNMASLFSYNEQCRVWFANNILYSHQRVFPLFLFESTSADVRYLFSRILVALMDKSKDDEGVNIEHIRKEFRVANESVTDLIIRTLLILPKNNAHEFGKHPCQYFALFHQFASIGTDEKTLLLHHNVLSHLIGFVLEDQSMIRNMYAEMGRCHQTIALLLRFCDVSQHCRSPSSMERVKTNPFALASTPLPVDIGIFNNAEMFCKKWLDQSSGNDVTKVLLQYLCWENMGFTKCAFKALYFEILHTWNEIRYYPLKIFEALLQLADSWQRERIICALSGDTRDNLTGLFNSIQINRSNYPKKCYSMLKMITNFFHNSQLAFEILQSQKDLKEHYAKMVVWLDNELKSAMVSCIRKS